MKKVLILTCFCLLLFLTGNAYADMDIHFLDVGDADAAIFVCDGEVMVIDAGEASHSQLIYSYLRTTLGVDSVKYVIMSLLWLCAGGDEYPYHIGADGGVLS